MSDKHKYPHAVAAAVAQVLCVLIPAERIIIAGSLRRMKPEVGDIEILYIPKMGKDTTEMFEPANFNITENEIQRLVDVGVIRPRENARSAITWGLKNKLAVHCETGIPVDLFATTPENWYVSLVVRTGGKDNNIALAAGAHRIRRRLRAYGAGVEDMRTGEVLRANSEREVFELCGMPYLEPEKRL